MPVIASTQLSYNLTGRYVSQIPKLVENEVRKVQMRLEINAPMPISILMKVVAQTVYIETCLSAKIITTLPITCIGPISDAAVIAIALGMLLSAKSGSR